MTKKNSERTPEQIEKQRAQSRRWYRANKKHHLAKSEKWKKKNPERTKYIFRRCTLSKYGIGVEEFSALSEAQNHQCKICGRSASACRGGVLAVDHDHYTKNVRGLLCTQCNTAIGSLQDSPELLELAAAYLRAAGCS